jgi:hypothetical protein
MIVPHGEQCLFVGSALDFSEKVGQFFTGGQWVAFAIVWLTACRPYADARLLATKPPEGLVSNRWLFPAHRQ